MNARIENDFKSHTVDDYDQKAMEGVRDVCKIVAHRLILVCPEGRELSSALTRLEEVMFHANAAIARKPATPRG